MIDPAPEDRPALRPQAASALAEPAGAGSTERGIRGGVEHQTVEITAAAIDLVVPRVDLIQKYTAGAGITAAFNLIVAKSDLGPVGTRKHGHVSGRIISSHFELKIPIVSLRRKLERMSVPNGYTVAKQARHAWREGSWANAEGSGENIIRGCCIVGIKVIESFLA